MRLLKPLVLALFGLLASVGLAQTIPVPQINLSGNIGCQGFVCLNNGILQLSTDANHTMTAQETSALAVNFTSSVSLTATRNIIYPVGRFVVDACNFTSGGQNIQIIGASGTGVTITNGTCVRVWNNGTNFVVIGVTGTGSVLLNPLLTQNITQPGTTLLNANHLNSTFDATTLPSTNVIPNVSQPPLSIATFGNYEFVETADGSTTGNIYTYDFSTGVQVAVSGSPYVTTGCDIPWGIGVTTIGAANILLYTCVDSAAPGLYLLTINANGTLTALGSVTSFPHVTAGQYSLGPLGFAIDGTNVYVPVFGDAITNTLGAVAKVSIAMPSAPTITTTTNIAGFTSTDVACGGSFTAFPQATATAVSGNFIYISAPTEACSSILNVASSSVQVMNKTTMTLTGSPFLVNHSPQGIVIQGHVLYVAVGDNVQLVSIDITNPALLVALQTLSISGCKAENFTVQGQYAYAGCTYAGAIVGDVLKIDVSNPSNMSVAETYTGFNAPLDLVIDGRNLFIADTDGVAKNYMADLGGTYAQRLSATDGYVEHLATGYVNTGGGSVQNDWHVGGKLYTTGINTPPLLSEPCLGTDSGGTFIAGTCLPSYTGTGALTTATSDAITVTGASSGSICVFSPTNSTAASASVVGYVSAVTTNSVTITHAATVASGGTVNILCH